MKNPLRLLSSAVATEAAMMAPNTPEPPVQAPNKPAHERVALVIGQSVAMLEHRKAVLMTEIAERTEELFHTNVKLDALHSAETAIKTAEAPKPAAAKSLLRPVSSAPSVDDTAMQALTRIADNVRPTKPQGFA